MFDMADDTLKNTRGTISISIRFTKRVPRGSRALADGPNMRPIIPPTMTDRINTRDVFRILKFS
jgi:hypothetical protein